MKKVQFKNLAEFKIMKGKDLPTSEWFTITQQMIHDFANATQDKQWVHVDVERAKNESPFKFVGCNTVIPFDLENTFTADS